MGKNKILSKEEAQKKLDWMVEFYAIRFLFKFCVGCMIALLPTGYFMVHHPSVWLVCLGIVISAFLLLLAWKWSIRFKKDCPYCGTPLIVQRKTWGIRDTVVSCPNCHLESYRFQNYEPDPP